MEQKSGTLRLALGQVRYFVSEGRKIAAAAEGERISFYGKLGEVEEELPDFFVRCHNRYLVNLNYVTKLESAALYCEGEKIPVSRSCSQETAAAFCEVYAEMMVSKKSDNHVLSIIYVSFIFRFLLCFLKLKQGLLQKAAAIAGVWIVGCTVVFPEDPFNVFGMLVLFAMVLLICFEGSVVRRLSVVLLLYPIIVSVNFVTLDATGIVFQLTPRLLFGMLR